MLLGLNKDNETLIGLYQGVTISILLLEHMETYAGEDLVCELIKLTSKYTFN